MTLRFYVCCRLVPRAGGATGHCGSSQGASGAIGRVLCQDCHTPMAEVFPSQDIPPWIHPPGWGKP